MATCRLNTSRAIPAVSTPSAMQMQRESSDTARRLELSSGSARRRGEVWRSYQAAVCLPISQSPLLVVSSAWPGCRSSKGTSTLHPRRRCHRGRPNPLSAHAGGLDAGLSHSCSAPRVMLPPVMGMSLKSVSMRELLPEPVRPTTPQLTPPCRAAVQHPPRCVASRQQAGCSTAYQCATVHQPWTTEEGAG